MSSQSGSKSSGSFSASSYGSSKSGSSLSSSGSSSSSALGPITIVSATYIADDEMEIVARNDSAIATTISYVYHRFDPLDLGNVTSPPLPAVLAPGASVTLHVGPEFEDLRGVPFTVKVSPHDDPSSSYPTS